MMSQSRQEHQNFAPSPDGCRNCLLVIAMLLTLLGPISCRSHAPKIARGAYFWRTEIALSSAEQQALHNLAINRLYLRFFDVTWDYQQKRAMPIAPAHFAELIPAGLEIIPVIFIKNAVFHEMAMSDAAAMASQVWNKIRFMANAQGFHIQEIQLDCDWTETTRVKFFHFSASIQKLIQPEAVSLSATIRLHQVKYHSRTGIPPVSRGALMFYNMGQISAAGSLSSSAACSIYNRDDAQKYSASIARYPLPLDLILPIFGWSIQSRANEVLGIRENIGRAELEAAGKFHEIKANRFLAKESFFFQGGYVKGGDIFTIEEISPALALEAAKLVAASLGRKQKFGVVSFFALHERSLARYEPSDFEKIFHCFE
jgi:hypothetical protein